MFTKYLIHRCAEAHGDVTTFPETLK